MLEYFLTELYYIWTFKDIRTLLRFVLKDGWSQAVDALLFSKCLQSLIFGLEFRD
jgi:hypothetical protein